MKPKHPALKSAFLLVLGLSIILALPLSYILLYSVPPVSLAWDWANALGYIATGLFLLLFIYASRPHTFPPFSLYFFTHFHRDLGLVALLTMVLHVVILLVAESLLIEHLKLTAPWYMLSGLLAVIMIILLVVSSLTRVRRWLWPDYDGFRKTHKFASLFIALLIGFHLAGSNYYQAGMLKQSLLILITLIVTIYYFSHDKGTLAKIKNRLQIYNNTSAYLSFILFLLLGSLSLLALWIKSSVL